MATAKYIGLFFNEQTKKTLEEATTPLLKNTILDMHVTLQYQPPEHLIPYKQLGQEFEVVVDGIGNDGVNQGLRVQLDSELEKFYDHSKPGVPHITVSLGNRAKARNTATLEYRSIEQFKVRGKLGYYTYDGCICLV